MMPDSRQSRLRASALKEILKDIPPRLQGLADRREPDPKGKKKPFKFTACRRGDSRQAFAIDSPARAQC
jgi:hypothetical protein